MTKISYHTYMKSGLKTFHASQFILVSKAIFCLSLQLYIRVKLKSICKRLIENVRYGRESCLESPEYVWHLLTSLDL